ncbi:hypothetical protein P3592_32580 [Vibrio parahaemolyticus]|nr:hypothetical protein [Vibrio parahaemolyticus]MDF4856519.1 hypothetical protein [Vibrio parahaemolyticus]
MEIIKLLNLEFSTADAEYPSIHQEEGDLLHGSSWLIKHVQSEIINDHEGYKHYRLNFNEVGQLDVIAINLRVRT